MSEEKVYWEGRGGFIIFLNGSKDSVTYRIKNNSQESVKVEEEGGASSHLDSGSTLDINTTKTVHIKANNNNIAHGTYERIPRIPSACCTDEE